MSSPDAYEYHPAMPSLQGIFSSESDLSPGRRIPTISGMLLAMPVSYCKVGSSVTGCPAEGGDANMAG